MIPSALRVLPRCALCIAIATGTLTAEKPLSIFCTMQQHLAEVATLQAALHRTQTFRNVSREARGTLKFDRTIGTLYQWKSPGRYSFFAADTLLYGIDVTGKCGWKKTGPPEGLISRQRIDPLFRLLRLQQMDTSAITYRGNDSTRLYFSIASTDSTSCTVGLDPAAARCSIIETFDAGGRLLDKTVFAYENRIPLPAVPSAIMITELVGSELSADTVRIERRHCNKKIDRSAFVIPEGIDWNRNGCKNIPRQ